MPLGGEMQRKEALYDIMDGKNDTIVGRLAQDPELKTWKCKSADE